MSDGLRDSTELNWRPKAVTTLPDTQARAQQVVLEWRQKYFGESLQSAADFDDDEQDLVERIAAEGLRQRLEGVAEYKKALDVPELEDFAKGVVIEAQHQRQRWGDEHDTTKEAEEWFWIVGYLAGKALQSQRSGDMEKFKHHLITGAAVLANWHARVKAELQRQLAAMQPGATGEEG